MEWELIVTITQVVKKKRCFKIGFGANNEIEGTLSEIVVKNSKVLLIVSK